MKPVLLVALLLGGEATADAPPDPVSAWQKILSGCKAPIVPKKWQACRKDGDCVAFVSAGPPDVQGINRRFLAKMANRTLREGECPPLAAGLGAPGDAPIITCESKQCVARQ